MAAICRSFKRLSFLKHQSVCLNCTAKISTTSFKTQNIHQIASSAEKIVGYQTNLLRCLLSDEISSVLVQSKKLVGTRHPLLKTARNFVYERDKSLNSVGMIVLLVSRCGELSRCVGTPPPLGENSLSGIEQKQRKLAEIAEMINTGYIVHLGMVNSDCFQPSDDKNIMNFGNKVTVLSGDFFLAKASVGLSELENTEVVGIMAEVLGDIVEGETMKDNQSLHQTSVKDMEHIMFKSWASLVAKSCLCSSKLRQLLREHQDAAYQFGKNLAFLQKLSNDYKEMNANSTHVSLNNIFVVQNKHKLPVEVQNNPLNTVITVEEHFAVPTKHFDMLGEVEELAYNWGNAALNNLDIFPNSEAKSCLQNLVQHLMTLTNK